MEAEKEKEAIIQKEEEKKDAEKYNFIYFIDSHVKTKKFNVYLSDAYEGKNTLEKIKEQ